MLTLLSNCADDEARLEFDSLRPPGPACCTDSVAMRDSSSAGSTAWSNDTDVGVADAGAKPVDEPAPTWPAGGGRCPFANAAARGSDLDRLSVSLNERDVLPRGVLPRSSRVDAGAGAPKLISAPYANASCAPIPFADA